MTKSLLLTKAGQIMEMANMLKEGRHAHPGAVDPHDLRVQHIGTDNDMDDPLHKEESKAYAAAKKAEQAVRDSIAQLRSGRRQIMASPQNHQKAMMAVQEARANYADAQSQLETVSNRRVEQLQHLVETLGLAGTEEQQGGEQLDQDWQTGQMNQASYGGRATPAESAHFQSLISPPATPKPASTGAGARRPAATSSPKPPKPATAGPARTPAATSSPKPATPPSAPSPGQTPAATARRNTRGNLPKKPPTAMDPAKRIGEAGKQAFGGVAGHYMNTLASTPYDRAMPPRRIAGKSNPASTLMKHGDHSEGYFDDARKDEPKVDAQLVQKHDTPNSPHSQHATGSGGDPDELTQRRQGTRPEEQEPPEWLERENQQRARRGFPEDEEPGPRPITPYAAAQKLALNAEATRTSMLERVYNNRGMNEGMEDEDAKLDNHRDSEGSTEHHQDMGRQNGRKVGGQTHYHNPDNDPHSSGARGPYGHFHHHAEEGHGLDEKPAPGGIVSNALRLAKAIHKAISCDVTAVGESHDPNKLTHKGEKGGGDASARPISGEDYRGVREETDSIFQADPDSETVTITKPRFKRGPGPLAKARAINRAIRRG